MNNGEQDEPSPEPAPSVGLGLDDVFYTLFRHKHIILAGVALGLIAAVAVRLTRKPVFESHAEISVPYISESTGLSPTSPADQITRTDPNGLNILGLEVRILSSLNLLTNVAQKVGPHRILAPFGGGDDVMAAAWRIDKGLAVATPMRTGTLTVSFRHPDQEVVQPVLAALIEAYQIKSAEIHQGVSAQVDYLVHKRQESRANLDQTEDEIKKLKTTNNVLFPEDTKEAYKKHIAKVQDELFQAREELENRRSELTGLAAAGTNATEITVEPAPTEAYSELVLRLEELKKRQRTLLGEYTDSHPEVVRTKAQIAALTGQKSDMEREFPALTRLGKTSLRSVTNSPPLIDGLAAEDTQKLITRVAHLQQSLTNLQATASTVMELEAEIAVLQRRHDDELKDYQIISRKLEKAQDGAASGTMTDVRVVQSPTPPGLDFKKLVKLVGAVFAGFAALGLGIAFLIDLVFDRTIKRSTDLKRQLHLPVILTIPHTAWSGGWCPAWMSRNQNRKIQRFDPGANPGVLPGESGITPWNPVHHLRRYTDGLRERLITYFEVNHLTHQPKLVAVTSCDAGVGVTTLASGLAASLSMTGNGNVLLVDMSVAGGAAHSFHKGKPGCDLSETPETEEGAASANHYLATLGGDADVSRRLPSMFHDVLPELKVRGYDYIVFDMPPVSQTSLTPRLSSQMDIALLVIESEKTNKQVAAESSALMREARAKVTTILNKCKAHVPAGISTGF